MHFELVGTTPIDPVQYINMMRIIAIMAEVVWRDVVEGGWQKLGDVKIAKAEKAVVERAEAPKLFPSHTWTTSL